MMLLVESDQDLTVSAADRSSVAERVVEGLRGETDVVDDQVKFIGRDGLADLVLYLAEERLGGFDSGSGLGPHMEPNLSRIDSGKEISANKRKQYKRRCHDGNRGKQCGLAM